MLSQLLSNIGETASEATNATDDSFDPTALALELSILSERGAEKVRLGFFEQISFINAVHSLHRLCRGTYT